MSNFLKTEANNSSIADLEAAIQNAAKGVRDPQQMQLACERMDWMREENKRLFGEKDIGVAIIREMRGELPDA